MGTGSGYNLGIGIAKTVKDLIFTSVAGVVAVYGVTFQPTDEGGLNIALSAAFFSAILVFLRNLVGRLLPNVKAVI